MLALTLLAFLQMNPSDALLHWMDGIAQQQLSHRDTKIAAIHSTDDAERRRVAVRAKILELMGGLPDYQGPLNPHITGKIGADGYTIDKLYFESLPRFFVTANLYKPKPLIRGEHYPGILIPLGHWDEGKSVEQRIAANLAMKGFVVLVYDPMGQGERLQAFDARAGKSLAGGSTEQHILAGAQSLLTGGSFARYRLWDATRALDYLASLPEVDAKHLGATGCSGGGTLTTYIAALDPRIQVAAVSCYLNSYKLLFSGPVGDSEQSLPSFISSGLDETDYVELFAPKPLLMTSTEKDFFTPAAARIVYDEARGWYRIYNAGDRIKWVIGPGGHGTPLVVREAIYDWMIHWLKNGHGSSKELPVEFFPDYEFRATSTGQVSTSLQSRDIQEVIRDEFEHRKQHGSGEELRAELMRLIHPAPPRVVKQSEDHSILFETDPGLKLTARLLVPPATGTHPGVVVVQTELKASATALDRLDHGEAVLILVPRGLPFQDGGRLSGDWLANTRDALIGRNLPADRAHDILCGVDLLAQRPDVDISHLEIVANGVPGIWALLAADVDPRIKSVSLTNTPASLRAAFDDPLSRNLHSAVIPGFALKWDLSDLPPANWTDPTDWMGNIIPLTGPYHYTILPDR
ncbi:MAG: acetylxylan esterase [Bryobacteraceae bacterium]